MSELIFAPRTTIGNVTYTTVVKDADNNGKTEKAVVITAEHSDGRTQSISIFASGGTNDKAFDGSDKIVITKNDASNKYFDINKGYMTEVLTKSRHKTPDSLVENTMEEPEQSASSDNFSLLQKGSKVTNLDELWKLATAGSYDTKNQYGTPGSTPISSPAGYTPTGAAWSSHGTSTTVNKELSPRAQEYQAKLKELQQMRAEVQDHLNKLINHEPTARRDAMTHGDWCWAYNLAGNGSAIDQYNELLATIPAKRAELEQLKGAEKALNEEYKDVAEEVKSYTINKPGQIYQPAGIGNHPPKPDSKDNDNKTRETTEEKEEDDTTKITKKDKPKDLDEAKDQVKDITKAAKELKDDDRVPDYRKAYANAAIEALEGIQDKLDKGEITLEEAQEAIKKAKEELEKAIKGDGKRETDDNQTIEE